MSRTIRIRGASQNNLKNLSIDLPLNAITVVTGVSGSGKSSLAFDTLYAEGQRRYIESFSAYARQFMDRMDKPLVRRIDGILPAIAINQSNPVKTSRSTLGTLTEISDYLKLLYPRIASLLCRQCGRPVEKDSSESIARKIIGLMEHESCLIAFPLQLGGAVPAGDIEKGLRRQGFFRAVDGGRVVEITPHFLSERAGAGVSILADRLTVSADNRKRLIDSLETALKFGRGTVQAHHGPACLTTAFFSTALHCPACDIPYREPSANLFSFNSPLGACEHCNGFGKTIEVDLQAVIPDPGRSLKDDAIKPWSTPSYREAHADLLAYCRRKKIPATVPFRDLPQTCRDAVIMGDDDFYGVMGFFSWLETKTYKMHIRVLLSKYRAYATCAACRGTRFKQEALLYRIGGKTIAEVYAMSTADSLRFFRGVRASGPHDATVGVLLDEICGRLGYLQQVGLGYLTLDRQSRTLSGGEIERASLTRALGSSLVNTLYILDEPSIGLHPRDTHMLISILKNLRDQGNTIVVVEHDPDIILQSDRVIDLGPASGAQGGEILFCGTPGGMLACERSLTGRHLSGRREIPPPPPARAPNRQACIAIRGAAEHNLKSIHLGIPLRQLVCITGVSGSGKSTLLENIIRDHLARRNPPSPVCRFEGGGAPGHVMLMDQAPIGRTPRSNPVTYIKAFDAIRALFAASETAAARGYTAATFSFNSPGGRCEQCRGEGFEKIEMQFLADVFITCSACRGTRYMPEVLDVTVRDKNIRQVLDLTVSEARAFFADVPKIEYPLRIVDMVGLGYLKLGQPANTLSGGESQRLKIASCILGGSSGSTLFLFDEPTTGLHFDDIRKLLDTFAFLIRQGHSIIVVEHNLEMITCADHIIDLGPEGGDAGGSVVFSGPPDRLVQTPQSHTGQFLRAYLSPPPAASRPPEEAPRDARASGAADECIVVEGAREHNLKNISLRIPRDRLIVITGLSGSGKSTLAFDILYAEGQRRFLETLSPYARQYIHQMQRPDVDTIRGLPPTVAIEQLLSRGGKKSTVATITEIYHYLRLLFAKAGRRHCPSCGNPLTAQTPRQIARDIVRAFGGATVMLLAPQVRGRKGFHKNIIQSATRGGYEKIRIDGAIVELKSIFAVRRYHEHQIDIMTAEIEPGGLPKERLHRLVNAALALGSGELCVCDASGLEKFYSIRACCPACKISLEEPDPRLFSFNSAHGACRACAGLGTSESLSPELLISDSSRSINGGALIPLAADGAGPALRRTLCAHLRDTLGIPLDAPLNTFSAARRKRLFYGTSAAPGLIALLEDPKQRRKPGWEEFLAQFQQPAPCAQCGGSRLTPAALSVKIGDKSIYDLIRMTSGRLLRFLESLSLDRRQALIAKPILEELRPKLDLLHKAGLSYLTLDRSADTLSGGEAQRLRLAAQVASNLRGVAYVLDEPTVGLHPHDTLNLMAIIRELQHKGNSVIIVEHDEEIIRQADHIIDLGPGGGVRGGSVMASGRLRDILQSGASVTGAHLAGRHKPRPAGALRQLYNQPAITLAGACRHNLKQCTASFPTGRLTVVTGVSGSGKTTLVQDTLVPGLRRRLGLHAGSPDFFESLSGSAGVKRVAEIDQSPIGKTPRSVPATYVGFYDAIRRLFAQVPEARIRGYSHARFSFNLSGGRCEKCSGQGKIKVGMSFLPDMYVSCEVCRSSRFNEETLQILFKGRNIAQVLEMTVEEGREFFKDIPAIFRPLDILHTMGLGYVTLGQPSPTLSGGEAQRIKIATELCKNDHGSTLYIFDEPTTGLHAADILKLMVILQELVDRGNTVIIIEHNLDVIEQADFIVDLGPGGGDNGGEIVASGSPRDVAFGDFPRSLTARYLRERMERTRSRVA